MSPPLDLVKKLIDFTGYSDSQTSCSTIESEKICVMRCTHTESCTKGTFEKVTDKKEGNNYHAIFKKEENPYALLIIKGYALGSGLGKGGPKWTYTSQVVEMM
jgi:hypothetical protein